MSISKLRDLIIKHEGNRLKPYLDCCGKYWRDCICQNKGRLTIGVGRNLDDLGITSFESMVLLNNDLARCQMELTQNFPWFKSISVVRQDAVIDMYLNLGLPRFQGFKRMLDAISAGNFIRAADEMLSSVWASQVKYRAIDLAYMMRTDTYP